MDPTSPSLIDERALSRLRWRCRRGLLENDLLLERFFERHAATLTGEQGDGLMTLMELSDNDLLDLFMGRTQPDARALGDTALQVLRMVRGPY